MSNLKIGYARVSTANQDLTAQRDGLAALGVAADRIYVDHGLTGTTRARPGLREALAACHTGDTLVVTKLDRLARSLPDARDIVAELTTRGVRLQLGGSVHDPTDPVGRLLFNVLAMVAEFESDLIRARTREGMAVARAAGRLRGRTPKLSPAREALLVDLHASGQKTPSELVELFGVGRSTVYRALERSAAATAHKAATARPIAPASEPAQEPPAAAPPMLTPLEAPPSPLPVPEASSKPPTTRPATRRPRQRWFVVQYEKTDPPNTPVAVLTERATQAAADKERARWLRRESARNPQGLDVKYEVRAGEQIQSRIEWDTTLKRAVVRDGPPPAKASKTPAEDRPG